MKSYRSTEKSCDKRILNVNIDKQFQMDQISAIKYRTKTSNKHRFNYINALAEILACISSIFYCI